MQRVGLFFTGSLLLCCCWRHLHCQGNVHIKRYHHRCEMCSIEMQISSLQCNGILVCLRGCRYGRRCLLTWSIAVNTSLVLTVVLQMVRHRHQVSQLQLKSIMDSQRRACIVPGKAPSSGHLDKIMERWVPAIEHNIVMCWNCACRPSTSLC